MGMVNVIDSIVITSESNTSYVLAEWSAFDPDITVHHTFSGAQATKLFINWSDKNGNIDLHGGDYFTFAVPDVFRQNISNVTDAVITTPSGDVIATYSIYDNEYSIKEVKMTFTNFVDTHSVISGDLWLLLFVGSVESTEEKTIEFVVNGELAASGQVTVTPQLPGVPHNEKGGHSALGDIYNGYYIFNWVIRLNMDEDTVNGGFQKLENFSFEDIIPEDSPHVFLTDAIRQELGILPHQFPLRIGEYMSADPYSVEDRYPLFLYQYNATGDEFYYFVYAPLVNGYTNAGIDGSDGLNVTNLVFTEKTFSANLGTLTRPTGIQYCTIATVKITERALGDAEVVKLFTNTFKVSHGKDMTSSLIIHRFESGGQGIVGEYNFSFTKVTETGDALPITMFSLYLSDNFELGANRLAYSDSNGIVTFMNLPKGIYYIRETSTPYGYVPNNTVYKVVLESTGFEIYYGDNYENRLSDHDNKIINRLAVEVLPVKVKLEGAKNLTGQVMSDEMFHFTVKDSGGEIVATGTNTANGKIIFTEFELYAPGVYTFTVEEVEGSYSRVIYDDSQYTVTVTAMDDGNGHLITQMAYPDGDIVFNNAYDAGFVSITLEGAKNFIGQVMLDEMFHFTVKNIGGEIVATGTNTANGKIIFTKFELYASGVYTFTVEEVAGSRRGVIYDSSQYTVTVTVTDDGTGNLTDHITYPNNGVTFINRYDAPIKPCYCYARSTRCRKSIEGRKIWIDNNNAGNTRPTFVEIILMRDGEIYQRINVDSSGDRTFLFCCLPIWKNPRHRYEYRIDEAAVPDGYTKTIEGYNIINTLTP